MQSTLSLQSIAMFQKMLARFLKTVVAILKDFRRILELGFYIALCLLSGKVKESANHNDQQKVVNLN